jgi:hypothetical protein
MLINYNVLYSGLHYIHCDNTFPQFNLRISELNHKIWKESVTTVYEKQQFRQNNFNALDDGHVGRNMLCEIGQIK